MFDIVNKLVPLTYIVIVHRRVGESAYYKYSIMINIHVGKLRLFEHIRRTNTILIYPLFRYILCFFYITLIKEI